MEYAVEIKGLKKTYSDGFTALKGLDLTVSQGDFFALLGPNGAGKSTIIGILTSLVNKSAGLVKIFGHDIDKELATAQSLIGIVPQEFNFGIFEKVENIIYQQAGFYGVPPKVAKPRVEYYLKKLALWDKRHTQSKQLSGGMKRRLMIARAMIHEPRLLILDEPTAGVDLEIRHAMWAFINELNATRKTTIILTTHYLEEAEQLCKNIAIIDQGRVIKQTDMQSLLGQLNSEKMVLDIETPNNDKIQVDGFAIVQRDSTTIEVEITKNDNITQLLVALEKQNIRIKGMRNKNNRLEKLFLHLVHPSS